MFNFSTSNHIRKRLKAKEFKKELLPLNLDKKIKIDIDGKPIVKTVEQLMEWLKKFKPNEEIGLIKLIYVDENIIYTVMCTDIKPGQPLQPSIHQSFHKTKRGCVKAMIKLKESIFSEDSNYSFNFRKIKYGKIRLEE